MLPSERDLQVSRADRFASTHWSLVLAAKDRASPQSQEALAVLCQAYWYPLYAFVRRERHNPNDALELTQEFFARLLEKDYLHVVDRGKGKFRSFLLASLGHFLCNEYDRNRAQKRGGRHQLVGLNFKTAEDRFTLEPSHTLTPEKLFERGWALALLDHVLARLRQEFVVEKKSELFDRLKGFLTPGPEEETYGMLADDLGMTPGSLKVAIHRLRRRYRELLRDEIGRTVEKPEDVDEEIRDLFSALGP